MPSGWRECQSKAPFAEEVKVWLLEDELCTFRRVAIRKHHEL